MKITKTQLSRIIKEELEKSMSRGGAEIEAEERLVNAALDFQKVVGDARAARSLREMADSIERGQ